MQRLNDHNPSSDVQKDSHPQSAFAEKTLIVFIVLLIIGGCVALYLALHNKLGSFFENKKLDNELTMIEQSVVNVVCPEAGKPFDFSEEHVGGTGYVLNESGKILTNFHIIASDEDQTKVMNLHEKGCFVLFPEKETGYSDDTYIAEPIYYKFTSPDYDFAYMQINDVYTDEEKTYGQFPRIFPALEMDTCSLSDLSIGDEVVAFGYPGATEGYSLTMVKGIVSAFSSYDSFYTTANLGSGGSGGIVIVPKKNCLAGIYAGIVYDEHVSYGEVYSTDSMLEFMDKSENIDGVNE